MLELGLSKYRHLTASAAWASHNVAARVQAGAS